MTVVVNITFYFLNILWEMITGLLHLELVITLYPLTQLKILISFWFLYFTFLMIFDKGNL